MSRYIEMEGGYKFSYEYIFYHYIDEKFSCHINYPGRLDSIPEQHIYTIVEYKGYAKDWPEEINPKIYFRILNPGGKGLDEVISKDGWRLIYETAPDNFKIHNVFKFSLITPKGKIKIWDTRTDPVEIAKVIKEIHSYISEYNFLDLAFKDREFDRMDALEQENQRLKEENARLEAENKDLRDTLA